MICTKIKHYRMGRISARPCFFTYIEGSDYKGCVGGAYAAKRPGDDFIEGLMDKKNGAKADEVGRLGELAFGHIVDEYPDLSYRPYGDEHDFVLSGKGVDIKTTTRKDCCLVRSETDNGKKLTFRHPIYVTSHVHSHVPGDRIYIVTYGFFLREEVISFSDAPAKIGKHKNKELYFAMSSPIMDMLDPFDRIGAVSYVNVGTCNRISKENSYGKVQ
jgi:hypothetical protein